MSNVLWLPVKSSLWSLSDKEDNRDSVEDDTKTPNDEHEHSFHQVLIYQDSFIVFYRRTGILTSRVEMLLRESLSISCSDSVILNPKDSFSVASSRNELNMPKTSCLAMAGLSENEYYG